MPTYRTSARNQLRTPLGAVGDAPDVPGYLSTFSDDVDNILGVGGAEYCANAAAVAAIPSSRLFFGKLVYRADQDCVYRYVGIGNTALRGNDTTHPWQAWFLPGKSFTPTWANLTIGASTVLAQYGCSAGLLWMDVNVTAGTGYALPSTTNDVSFSPSPSGMICGLGVGTGLYTRAGGSGNNSTVDLVAFPIGTTGQAATGVRLRAKYANAAPGPVTQNILGSVITAAVTDSFQFSLRGPAAGVM